MKNKYEEDYTIKKWIAILVVVLMLVFLFFILLMGHSRLINCEPVNNNNDNVTLIISFIGVIATFIVVGNFTQTSHILSETKEKLRSYDERVKKGEAANNTANELSSRIQQLDVQIKKITENYSEQNTLIDEKSLAQLLLLFIGAENEIGKKMQLYAQLLDDNSIYMIQLKTSNILSCKIKINADNAIEFYSVDNEAIDSELIDKVNDVKLNLNNLNYVYRLLNQIDTQESGDINNENTGETPS